MPDHENTGSGRRSGSLLSLAGGDRRERHDSTSSSLLSAAMERESKHEDDQVLQHRLARSRREARPNPLLHALAAKPDPREKSQSEIDDAVAADLDADFDDQVKTRKRAERKWRDASPVSDERDDIYRDPAGQSEEDAQARAQIYDHPRPLIDPAKVISGIIRSKRLIAATTIAGALTGVLIALSTPKYYESFSEVLIDPRNIKLVDRELVSSDVSPNTAIAIVENQVRIMSSGSVIAKVVDRLNLDTDPEFNGLQSSFGLRSMLAELRSVLARRDRTSGTGRNHAIAVQNLLENLEVARSGKTFIVTVGVKTQSPEKSALIANTIVDVFMDYSGKSFSTTAGRAADELGAKLAELRAGVEEAERKVEAFKGEKDLIDARGHLIGDDEVIKINDQLAAARARTIELSAKAASARSLDLDSALGGALPEGINSSLITELRTQYADLIRKANQIAVKYGSKHPESRTIQAQISGARDQLRNELKRIAASMQVELKRAVELEQQLSARLATLKARQVDVSDDMVTLRELERESAAKRSVYESYLLRARETGELKDLNSANMSVISPAEPPLDPVGPSRSVISIAGMMAGFLLGVGLGGLRGAADGMFGGSPSSPPNRRPTPPGGSRVRQTRRWMTADEAGAPTEARTAEAGNQGKTTADASDRSEHARDTEAEAKPTPKPEPQPAAETVNHVAPQPAMAGYPAASYPQPYPPAPAFPQPGPYGGYPFPPAYPPAMPVYGMQMMPPPFYPPPYYPIAAAPAYPHAPAHPNPQQPTAEPPRENPPNTVDDRPAFKPESRPPERRRNGVEAIRDDLREVRSAIHDLAERRSRRRA